MKNPTKTRFILLCSMVGPLLWAYWPTLGEIVEQWSTKPEYSHGYLVPIFAGLLLWHRRGMISGQDFEPSWWGLPWVLGGVLLHLLGAFFYVDWISAASILPVLVGIAICLGGRRLFIWSWPAIAFLVFMLPLPHRVEVSLAYPLQRLATLASTYVLQTLGFAAIAEGNVIVMENARIGVVEACGGLGMLVTFFALATAVAILLPSRWADKVVIVLSAIPIALLANVIRVTLTGALAETVGSEIADLVFHDLAGWIMMPVALIILWIEKAIIDHMLIETASVESTFNLAEPRAQTLPQGPPVYSGR